MSDSAPGTAAAKAVGGRFVDITTDYLVPIGTVVAGIFIGNQALGGASSVANAIYAATQSGQNNPLSSTTMNRVVGVIFAAIWGAIGYAFWQLGKRDGWVEHLLGKGLGGFFFGTAIGVLFVMGLSAQNPQTNGLIDWFVGFGQKVASGG